MWKFIIDFYEKKVRELYKGLRRKEEFLLSTKVITIKKGTRRYDLVFIETVDGKIRINLGRRSNKHKGYTNFIEDLYVTEGNDKK